MVRIHPDPPTESRPFNAGAIAQLGERLLCKQEVTGSIPVGSTSFSPERSAEPAGSAVRFRIGCSLTTRKKQDDFGSMWTEITGFEIASSCHGLVGRGAFKRDLCNRAASFFGSAQGYRVK